MTSSLTSLAILTDGRSPAAGISFGSLPNSLVIVSTVTFPDLAHGAAPAGMGKANAMAYRIP